MKKNVKIDIRKLKTPDSLEYTHEGDRGTVFTASDLSRMGWWIRRMRMEFKK